MPVHRRPQNEDFEWFPDALRDGPVHDLVRRAERDLHLFSKSFLPESFSRPCDPPIRRMLRAMDSRRKQKKLVLGPRGCGKTTTVIARIVRDICYRRKNFIVYIDKSTPLAMIQTENIKSELASPLIQQIFGVTVSQSHFAQDLWETNTGCWIMPRGRGQQIRGALMRRRRPDLLALDDIEAPEDVENPNTVKKTRRWHKNDVEKCVDLGSPDWEELAVGTILSSDCLMENLRHKKDWYVVNEPLCDDKFTKSFFPSWISTQKMQRMVDDHREDGMLADFCREMMNMWMPEEECPFRQEMFRSFSPDDIAAVSALETVVLADLARSTTKESSDSSIVTVSIDSEGHRIFVRDVRSGRMEPDKVLDEMIDCAMQYRAWMIGVETRGVGKWASAPVNNEVIRRGCPAQVVELRPGTQDKKIRVQGLLPFYRRGQVFHNPVACRALEQQLLSFPDSKKWDIMDALAYVVPLFDYGGRYFIPFSEGDPAESDRKYLAELRDEDRRDMSTRALLGDERLEGYLEEEEWPSKITG